MCSILSPARLGWSTGYLRNLLDRSKRGVSARHVWGTVVHNRAVDWQTARPGATYDVLAPDGAEIRVLVSVPRASMVHCSLAPGRVTRAVQHRTVEEVWYCVSGTGQLWRKSAEAEEVVDLEPGVALSIPLGTAFQFRATGARPPEVVITTIPPWPGADEAIPVAGVWEPTEL
jgi:mannose-6-phosphate isomerase-like protein (cupin superfamily)